MEAEMALLGTWNGETPFKLFRHGDRTDEGGDGTTWVCTCAKGHPSAPGYPCHHLHDLWFAADNGELLNMYDYTPEGFEAAERCRCRTGEPMQLAPPKAKTPPPKPPEHEPSRNKPCPCGGLSEGGHPLNYKQCLSMGRHGPIVLEAERPQAPPAPPKNPREEARRKRAEKYAEKVDVIDTLLDDLHDKWNQQREKAQERAAKKAAERARMSAAELAAAQEYRKQADYIAAQETRRAKAAEAKRAERERVDRVLTEFENKKAERAAQRAAKKAGK